MDIKYMPACILCLWGPLGSSTEVDMKKKTKTQSSCDTCAYCSYDEDYECYMCDINMDEDELARFLSDSHYSCPYYRNGDEYAVVRKQM